MIEEVKIMKKTKKYTRNYLILTIISIVILYVAWWFLAQYKLYTDYQKNISTLEGVVAFTIQPTEIKPHIKENAMVFMYVANTHAKATSKIETNLLKLIDQYRLKDEIVLYNVSSSPDDLIKEINGYWENKQELQNLKAPMILFFKDGKLVDGISENKNNIIAENLNLAINNKNDQNLSVKDMYAFFKNYDLIEDIHD